MKYLLSSCHFQPNSKKTIHPELFILFVFQHNDVTSLVFTPQNVYFIVFVVVSVICFVIATLVRSHQQKKHQNKKEQEFLRYYHSVLPHSRIYGNLNETFAADNSKMRRKNSKKQKEEGGNTLKDKLMAAMYKRYPYNPYVSETEVPVISDDVSENGVDIVIENNNHTEEVEVAEDPKHNPNLKLHLKKKTVTWRKYSFANISTVL